jgi:hypothetical protein
MHTKILLLLSLSLLIFSCRRERILPDADESLVWTPSADIPQEEPGRLPGTGSEEQSIAAKVTWQLTALYSAVTAEESAYLKQVGPQNIVYPFVWDRNPNIDRDPTEDETGIIIPIANYRDIWIDSADLDGNGAAEIFMRLISASGHQLIYVYKLNGKIAQEIFALESTGELNLISDDKAGLIIESEEVTPNGVESIRYQFDKNTFRQTARSIKPQSAMLSNKETAAIRSLSTENQENFLNGPWLRMPADGQSAGSNGPADVIVHFKPETYEVVFGQSDMIEVFNWRISTRVHSGLLLDARNSQINEIANNITVMYRSNNEIQLRFTGDSVWKGIYKRMTAREKEASLPQIKALEFDALTLSGLFKSALGTEYTFSYPNFTIMSNDAVEKGTYAIFTINNQNIIEMRFLNSRGLVTDRKAYAIEFQERREGNRLVRTLSLTPGSLIVWGLEGDSNTQVYLEQIEFTAG